jgi:hypothetical protein
MILDVHPESWSRIFLHPESRIRPPDPGVKSTKKAPDPGSGTKKPVLWIWLRIRIHKSEVWIRIRILLSTCKNSKKNLDSYYFVIFFDFLSLKNDVNVPSKSNKQKKLC